MVVATGFFDGVHLGHRAVLGELVRRARASGDESLVITFWPHPRTVLQQEARTFRLLSSLEEKSALIRALGVDRVEVLPFTDAFSRMTARDYLERVVIGRFGARGILLGYDNRLGSDLLTPEQAEPLAASLGLEVYRAPRIDAAAGAAVSSTRIRNALAAGDVTSAAAMLGAPYQLFGVVVAGNRLGRTIGFPTANMQLYEPLKLIPGGGVYEVQVETADVRRRGMCNIGVRPTVGQGNALTVETHIFDFDRDIYGRDIRIHFLRRIREERRFASLEELSRQLAEDRDAIIGR